MRQTAPTLSRRTLLTLLAASAASSAPRAACATEPVPLRIAAMPIENAAEAFYALQMGFFKAAGIDASLTVMGTGSAIAAAIAGGSADIGFASPNNVIAARARGVDIRYVAPAAIYDGPPSAAALIVGLTSPMHTAADLKGTTIAVAGLRDLTQLSISAWLDKNGGDSKSVDYVEMHFPEMLPAVEQGRVAAAAVVEPFKTASKGKARILAELNGAIADRFLLCGWFATDDWLRRNADAARRFSEVIQRTAKWANVHHPDTAPMLARYSKIPPELIAKMERARYDEEAVVPTAVIAPVIATMQHYLKLRTLAPDDVVWNVRA